MAFDMADILVEEHHISIALVACTVIPMAEFHFHTLLLCPVSAGGIPASDVDNACNTIPITSHALLAFFLILFSTFHIFTYFS